MHGATVRAIEDARLELEIRAAHRESRETYGSERLKKELAAKGIKVGICRIRRMRKKLAFGVNR